MNRALRMLWTVCALGAASYACSSSDSDDDDDAGTSPTPMPTSGANKSFTLSGSGFQVAHIGQTAYVRVFVSGSSSNVVFCQQSDLITGGGVFSVSSLPLLVLTTGLDYRVELFANVATDGGFTPNTSPTPDHIYILDLVDVQDDVDIAFPHGVQASFSDFTWHPGIGCPGFALP